MPASEAQLKAIAKYDKENYQHISFKVRIGSRDRIKEAAEATNQSVNGFIKNAISDAMIKAINKPLEPTDNLLTKNEAESEIVRKKGKQLTKNMPPKYKTNKNKKRKLKVPKEVALALKALNKAIKASKKEKLPPISISSPSPPNNGGDEV